MQPGQVQNHTQELVYSMWKKYNVIHTTVINTTVIPWCYILASESAAEHWAVVINANIK